MFRDDNRSCGGVSCSWILHSERVHLIIYQDQKRVYKKWLEDDKKDENGDGVADVKEMTDDGRETQIFTHRSDGRSGRLGETLTGINTGILAVLASLQVRFAKALTLSSALGVTMAAQNGRRDVLRIWRKRQIKYRKWVKPTAMYSCKFVGFMFAMSIWRMIMAIHSSPRVHRWHVLHLDAQFDTSTSNSRTTTKQVREQGFFIVTSGLALVGFYWQLSNGFRLPFPLNFFLLPVTVLESVLGYVAK